MAAGTQGGIQDMSTPVKVDVDEETRNALSGLAMGDVEVLGEALELREAARESSGLDPRSFALVKIAALIALDSPPASYLWQISNAIDAGASPQDILGVLKAVAPQVGGPKAISAAPEIMVALGLSLPRSGDF
jgi:4-carboxymuconolactone decarboxylase